MFGLSFNTGVGFPAIFFTHRLWDGYNDRHDLTIKTVAFARFRRTRAVPIRGGIMFPVGDIATHQSLRGPR